MIKKTLLLERRVCHTRMRQASLSGCFEVCDEPVISPVIHWQEKEKKAESERGLEETQGKKQTNGEFWNDICEYY